MTTNPPGAPTPAPPEPTCVATPKRRPQPPGSARHHRRAQGPRLLAQAARLLRAGLPRGRRLHGSRQLGDGPRRRLGLRLHAPQRHPALQPDGDPAPVALREAGHRHRPRSGAGVPRSLFTPVSFVLWILCEIAICACDLAEVIGSAIALNLLFGLPARSGACASPRSTCSRSCTFRTRDSATSKRWSSR